MRKMVPDQVEQQKNNGFMARWKNVVWVLACVSLFFTVRAMMLPAVTMTGDPLCGKEEHTHDEACKRLELVCTYEEADTNEDTAIEDAGDAAMGEPEEQTDPEDGKGTAAEGDRDETEKEEHIHGTECYVSILECDIEEHVHTKSCYSDRNADVETEEDWEKTIPDELTGNWAADVLAVAESQLGYKESTRNYIVTEDDATRGYTRYGEWYGDPYGHWCAMFVSFCLSYGQVDQEMMPQDANCQNWINTLSKEELDLYRAKEDYEPVPGDLIFFNWDEDAASDHVGLVVEIIEETEETKRQVKTIEGNAGDDEVLYRFYDYDDVQILGYGQLPENPEYDMVEGNIINYQDEDEFIEQTESEAPVQTFALYRTDEYAPEGISLTGSWATDVAAIANSVINYSESNGISKIDQWAGGNGTGAWNVNFVNYCMYYAGIDKDSIPWDESYDLTAFQSALESKGLVKGLGEMGLSVGDITICTTSWSSNDLVVGIVTSFDANTGIYKISFGDKDGSGRVVTDEYYADWYSRIMGVVRLSGKTTISNENYEIEVSHNIGDDIADVAISIEDNHANASVWISNIQNALGAESNIILANHFFDITFKNSDGNTFTPTGIVDMMIGFENPLSAEVPEDIPVSSVKWIYKMICNDNSVGNPEYAATTYTDVDQNIKKIKIRYEENLVYAFTSVQTDFGDIASSSVTSLNELMSQANSSDNIEIVLGADIDGTGTENSIEIGSGKNLVLDLNGHKLKTSNTFFIVNGGSFTLKDSNPVSEYEISELGVVKLHADQDYDEIAASDMIGRKAVYNPENSLLTYYVTETEVSNTSTGATTETLTEHKVALTGMIEGTSGSSAAIRVNQGNVNINGGAIVGCNDCAIYQTGGMIYMYDGYICGNKTAGSGGGIHSTGEGSICLKGGVIAANEVAIDGGGIYTEGDSLYIYEGIISGNVCTEGGSGGGIFARGKATISIDAGYITNNRCNSLNYDAGGGGIFTTGQAVLKLKGGCVTGNYAGGGGGGIRSSASVMSMTGGYVNSNYAETAEGGGISLGTPCAGTITAGYINNNVTNTYEHWGGGGLFCANGDNEAGTYASFYITNALVTENNAGGYGGGVAGCSTGRTYICAKEGGAIYDNKASEAGQAHLSGGTSWKNEDHLYATSAFFQYGYADYFSAFNSIVGGTMLGDCPANWTGSVDGLPVQAQSDDTLISSYFMGLNSNPNATGKQAASKAAKVYINGNESFTHGGGILCNGYLLIGEMKEVEVYSRLRLYGTKSLQSTNGDAPSLEAGQFRFEMVNKDTGMLVADGTNNEAGTITFDQMIPYTEAGVYTYRLYENQEKGSAGVIMDTTEYEIIVTVEKFDCGILQGNIKKYRYEISNLKVVRKNKNGTETIRDFDPGDRDSLPVELTITDDATFTNVISEGTAISVQKIWEGETPPSGTVVSVQLYRNGEPFGDVVELSENNGWCYEWGELPLSEVIDGLEHKYSYSVEELNVPEGYQPEYGINSGSSKNEFWVPVTGGQLIEGNEYIIVSPDKAYAFTPGSVNSSLTANDKTGVSVVTASVTDELGNSYDNYIPADSIRDNMIFYATRNDWNGIALRHKTLTGNPYISFDLSSYNSGSQNGYAVQMRTDRMFDLYMGNTQIEANCWNGDWNDAHNRTYAFEYNNGTFVMVYRDSAQASRVPYLYTKAYSVGTVGITYTITNKKVDVTQQRYSIEITKMSTKDANLLLLGARFELYQADENGNPILEGGEMIPLTFKKTASGRYEYWDLENGGSSSDYVTEGITVFGGKLVFANLPHGNYILRETAAPSGYDVIEDRTIRFGSGSAQTIALELADSPLEEDGFFLPETGGIGTSMYIYGGILLIGMAVLLLYIDIRKRA